MEAGFREKERSAARERVLTRRLVCVARVREENHCDRPGGPFDHQFRDRWSFGQLAVKKGNGHEIRCGREKNPPTHPNPFAFSSCVGVAAESWQLYSVVAKQLAKLFWSQLGFFTSHLYSQQRGF